LDRLTKETGRSACPINLTLEIPGDRWSPIVLRDMMFGNRRHSRELLTKSDEGIASNILADRLKRLVGQISRRDGASHKQKGIDSLTEIGVSLVPVFAATGNWGRRFLPVSEDMSIRAELLADGGPALWERFMEEPRFLHLGAPRPQDSVLERLTEAYRCAVERKRAAGAEPAAA
jgi:DNA-binding HxlR family transcriptional regulator